MSLASFGRRAGHWAANVLVSADILLNDILGGARRQTLSARAAIARNRGRAWGCVLCGLLDWLNPGHCDQALVPGEGAVAAPDDKAA